MAKGHWVRVHEGKTYQVAVKVLTSMRDLHKVKMTSHRLGYGNWYTVWKWVKYDG